MMEMAPCKDCTDKYRACHDSCDKYKEWRDRYHAQQKHLEESRYRMNIPISHAREMSRRNYAKYGSNGRKYGKGGL